jgi:hypothetical protein
MHRFAELNPLRAYRHPALNGDSALTFLRTFQSVQNKFDENPELPCSDPAGLAVFQKIIRRGVESSLTFHSSTFQIGSREHTTRTPSTIDVTIGHAGLFGRRVVSTDEMVRDLNKPARNG